MNVHQIHKSQQLSTLTASLQSCSRKASVIVALIGGVVILGWIFDLAALKSVFPGLVTMKANTAICFILGGASLRLWHWQPTTLMRRRAVQACALVVFLIGLATLIQYGFNINLGIDQLLFKDIQNAATPIPGRIAPNSALNFCLLGLSLLLLSRRRPNYLQAQFLAIAAFLIGFLGLLGYVYGNAHFYTVGSITGMAIHTAIAFLMLSLGILLARPDQGLMAVVTSTHAGGLMAQRLLPTTIIILPVVGWLILLGYRRQIYSAEMGICLFSIVSVVILGVSVWWNARALGKLDQQRNRAEQALQQTLEQLEQKVEERTAELQQANEQLQREISDRHLTELALQQSEERFRAALQNSPTTVFNQDTELRYTWLYNTPSELNLEAFLGKLDDDMFTAEEAQQLTVIKRQVLETGVRARQEVFITVDGEIRYYDLTVEPLRNLSGEIIGITCVAADITRLKQAEEEIRRLNETLERRARESETRYQQIVELSEEGIWVIDSDAKTTYVNQALTRKLGYTESEMLGRPISDFISSATQKACCSLIDFGSHNQVEKCEMKLKTSSGQDLWTYLSASPALDENGQMLWSCVLVYDITSRKQAEEQLRRSSASISLANAELARATRLKDEFLAGMSHELRTPLNAILGLSEALQEEVYGELTQRQRKSLVTIEQSGRHLLELINEILDLSKIESGKMELQLAPVSLESLCESSLTLVKQQAHQKNIKLNSKIVDSQSLERNTSKLDEIEVDERRIRQALVNLLSNAVKFTPEGGEVWLEVEANSDSETIQLSVSDTGIGIAQENLDKLFKPFVQLDSSLSRRYAGTGLGLALVRRLVELHDGSVSVESELGKGSRFTIILPWKDSDLITSNSRHREQLELEIPTIRRALIIEDTQPAAKQIARYMTELDAAVEIYPHGEGALEAALNYQPDVIILDILLPNLSGWEVLVQLKANPQTHNIPVLIVSVVDERSRALSLGASESLLKPISRQQLQFALARILPASSPNSEGASFPLNSASPVEMKASIEQQSPLILLAEDNEANLSTMMDYLQIQGFRLSVARNGIEAVEIAKQQKPDFILMDIQMPEMDGLEAIQQIRAEADLATITIIALTALAMPGDRERCIAAGANDYMSKPISLKKLKSTMAKYMGM
ncbi:MAG TPA: hypothetical protein DCP31_02415 [Cyanobacteria bacterium UBA8543]|nr:hypothetical protein [Cyanobacteria bacterium UBA8543]